MRFPALLGVAMLAGISPTFGQQIDVTDDSYKQTIDFSGPMEKTEVGEVTYVFKIGATLDRKTKARQYSLMLGAIYSASGWHYYKTAATEGGAPLKLTSRKADVGQCFVRLRKCVYGEFLQFEISESMVQSAAQKPLTIKLFGAGYDHVFEIRPDTAANLLAAIRARR